MACKCRRRPFGLGLLQQGQRILLDPLTVLVRIGGVQPEAGVFDLEGAAGLGDAAFAQQDGLASLGQRPADDGPLLQGMMQHDQPLPGRESSTGTLQEIHTP